MTGESDNEITYTLRLRLADGREVESGTFTTRRKREIGDLVNLPAGPDSQSEAGVGFIWRVTSVDDAQMLVLTFERAHIPER